MGPNDTWSYSIVYDSRDMPDLGSFIALSNAGTGNATVTVNHAGKVVIRATVVDDRYEGLVNGDTAANFTNGHGILMAVPLVPTIDASGTPYPVRIARIGARGTISKDTAVSCT
ncbi:MAG: hypothetical protein IKG18_10600 [Atopobiaceae bacterium]|nr:hypothetical protein [Atopobiaceae bacterium]